MASWIVHLRVAQLMPDQFDNLSETEFIVGNIAPDSGVPDENGNYVPSRELSHFKEDKGIKLQKFIDNYFSKDRQKKLSTDAFSFYLGYLSHLMTDILWSEQIFLPCKEKHIEEYKRDKAAFISKMKDDWYDLDFLFLSKNPDFKALKIYKNAVGFENTYMNIFSKTAFDEKRKYIIEFYSQPKDNLDREYPYLTEAEMNTFVTQSAEKIAEWVKEYTYFI